MSTWRATRYGAPDWRWRITSMSAPTAWRVRTVSTSDSPFSVLLPLAAMLMTSAPRLRAASSKEERVRVLAS